MSEYYILIDLTEIKMEIVENDACTDACTENIGAVTHVCINNPKLELSLHA